MDPQHVVIFKFELHYSGSFHSPPPWIHDTVSLKKGWTSWALFMGQKMLQPLIKTHKNMIYVAALQQCMLGVFTACLWSTCNWQACYLHWNNKRRCTYYCYYCCAGIAADKQLSSRAQKCILTSSILKNNKNKTNDELRASFLNQSNTVYSKNASAGRNSDTLRWERTGPPRQHCLQ